VKEVPPELGITVGDPKLVGRADGLLLPSADSPAVAGGFDPKPFDKFKPVTANDVGPEWARR
jgi:hypothetical protein